MNKTLNTLGKLEVAPVEDKIRGDSSKMVCSFYKAGQIDATGEENWLFIGYTSRGRGRFKKPWIEPVRIDLNAPTLTAQIVHDWTKWKHKHKVHVIYLS